MYKWGFFLMLAVNAVLFGNNLIKDEPYQQNSLVELRTDKGNDPLIRCETQSSKLAVNHHKPDKKVQLSKDEKRVEKIKDLLYKQMSYSLEYDYGYLFKHNTFSQNEVSRIKDIFMEMSLTNSSCCGDGIVERPGKLRQLIADSLSLPIAEKVLEMVQKEYAYNSVLRSLDFEGHFVADIKPLVEAFYDYYTLGRPDPILDALETAELDDPFEDETDPFAEDDPFAEAQIDDETDPLDGIDEIPTDDLPEELIAEIDTLKKELTAIALKNRLDDEYNELQDHQRMFYDHWIQLLSKQIEVTDELKLRVLSEIAN